MDSKEYQEGVERTRNVYCSVEDEMKNYCLGISSEAGELVGHIKHVIFHKHELNEANVVEEMGDILWYVTALAGVLSLSLSEIMEYNLIKLRKRYPEGFDPEKSINRTEEEGTPMNIDKE